MLKKLKNKKTVAQLLTNDVCGYKPNTRKYMTKMVRNEPMLDFFDRTTVFK